MFYRITEISNAEAEGLTYVLVDFWQTQGQFIAGKLPMLTNDFLMQLTVMSTRTVDDEVEEVERDLISEIRINIEAYLARATTRQDTGDHTFDSTKKGFRAGKGIRQRPTVPIGRDPTDPDGVLAAVQGLEGQGFTVPMGGPP